MAERNVQGPQAATSKDSFGREGRSLKYLGEQNVVNDAQDLKVKTSEIRNDTRSIYSHNGAVNGSTVLAKEEVTKEVPSIKTAPCARTVSTKEFYKVFFDLETSSRGVDAEICQIAATDGRDEFNVYVVPQHGITPGASAVNNLRKKKGILLHGKRRVSAVRQNTAVTQFLNWLKFKTPCLLIAHNAKAFDAKHLMKAVACCNETKELSQKVLGFSDTLMAFRERFPGRKSFSQTNLAKDLLEASYDAHNALEDVRMLRRLVAKFINDDLLTKHSFTVSWLNEYTSFVTEKNHNLKSLEPLVRSQKMSEGMAEKVAASGLRYEHLHLVFQDGGEQRLRRVLTEKHEGKPRVTNNEKILTQLCSYFKETLQ